MAEPVNKDTILYKFLIDPSYRWVRHLLVVFSIGVLSVNQAFFTVHGEAQEIIGYYAIFIFLYILCVFLSAGYFNIYILIPRYLLQKKYLRYGISLILVTSLILLLFYLEEWFLQRLFRVKFEQYSYLSEGHTSVFTFISDGMSMILCMLGVSMAVILKNWLWEKEQVSDLEKIRIRSEVERLREQVNPQFLFNILHHTGTIAENQPEKAAEMILNLSRLLRYQLYDGNREKVLLTGEIQFLINYLKLENLYSDRTRFDVITEGEINRAFILPLTFLPFARYGVEQLYKKETEEGLQFHIVVGEGLIKFTLLLPHKEEISIHSFSVLAHRLDLTYGENYQLEAVRYKERSKIQLTLKNDV